MLVTPSQGQVHSRCSIDGELRKQDRGGSWGSWASPTCPVAPWGFWGDRGEQSSCWVGPGCRLQLPPASASLLSHLQAAAGGEGSVRRLIVLVVLGGFLTLTIWGSWKSHPLCVALAATSPLCALISPPEWGNIRT